MNYLGIKTVQKILNSRIERASRKLLGDLSQVEKEYRDKIEKTLQRLNDTEEDRFTLGETEWGFPISLPISKLAAHSLVVGTTGAGKSYAVLLLLLHTLRRFLSGKYLPMGILDAKGELASKAVEYIQAFSCRLSKNRCEHLLTQKIYVIDFSQADYVTPYNILFCKNIPVELLINNRIETINQIYSGPSALTARMRSILKYFMLLMIENDLPLTLFEKLCLNSNLVKILASRSKDERLRHYFAHRFDKEPRSTVLGLRQRVDSLFVSEGVRLSLSARSAPDFRKLQDEGYLIIINVAGPQISRGTSEFLLRVVLSDISQSVFRRESLEKKYLWCLDEAQVLYKERSSRENMNDLLTMARSFGTFFMLITQSLTSAVRDTDIINSILANIRWVLLFRSTPRDAKIITPAIPSTGTILTQKRFLYDKLKLLTKEQELKLHLEEITHFVERHGYLWLKSDLQRAVKIKTAQVATPDEIAGCSRDELDKYIEHYPLGNRDSRERIQEDLQETETRINKGVFGSANVHNVGNYKTQRSNDYLKLLEQTYMKKIGKKGGV